MARRTIDWSATLRDLKGDRVTRSEVREERLKSTSGLRSSPAIPLSAWRGRSGRRYVVGVHSVSLDALDGSGPNDCLIFVSRSEHGTAAIVGFCSELPGATSARFEILRDAVREGAAEIHVHRLCEDQDERRALVLDLTPAAAEAA